MPPLPTAPAVLAAPAVPCPGCSRVGAPAVRLRKPKPRILKQEWLILRNCVKACLAASPIPQGLKVDAVKSLLEKLESWP